MSVSFGATWIWDTKRGGNLAEEKAGGRFEMSTGKIMTLDEEDGAHKLKDLKLRGDERWRNAMRMHRTDLVQLLVVEGIGKRLRVRWLMGKTSAEGHQKTKAIIQEQSVPSFSLIKCPLTWSFGRVIGRGSTTTLKQSGCDDTSRYTLLLYFRYVYIYILIFSN